MMMKKTSKPLSSSIIQEKKSLPTKQDILKINSKLELIKSKCMKSPKKVMRSDSKRTLQSQWDQDNILNDSVDIESTEGGTQEKGTVVNMIKSKYEDRPATVFFHYPKCCGIEPIINERIFTLEKANLTYKIAGS